MPKLENIHKIMIIGSGPIIIGQACEFDYSGTQACKALRQLGYEIVLVNSNPATIMTDPDVADITYIEPLNVARLTQIIEKERPDALLPNLGGQSGLLGILGLRSQTADLGCDLALFLGHPLVELGLGIALRERALGYAPQKVLLVEDTLVREDGTAGVGRLCAFLQPIQSPVELQINRSRIRIGIVCSQFLDEFTITWRSAICGNDMIERSTLLTMTCQTNFNSHLL